MRLAQQDMKSVAPTLTPAPRSRSPAGSRDDLVWRIISVHTSAELPLPLTLLLVHLAADRMQIDMPTTRPRRLNGLRFPYVDGAGTTGSTFENLQRFDSATSV